MAHERRISGAEAIRVAELIPGTLLITVGVLALKLIFTATVF